MSAAFAWRRQATTDITAATPLESELPFEDSRRLQGANLFFDSPGAVLDVIHTPLDDALIGAWRASVQRAGARLSWPDPRAVARRHAGGVLLAISAPFDQLLLATEVNEWALCAALFNRAPERWSDLEQSLIAEALQAGGDSAQTPAAGTATAPGHILPILEENAAFARFERLSSAQAHPKLRALLEAASARRLQHVIDESDLTLGAGAGSRDFPLDALPDVEQLPWQGLGNIPTAMVTGSNGKTTTVRLLAAMAREHGWHAAYNCTDGVFIDDEMLAAGDYSGPAGTRLVLRERRAQAAILETARGGILRRGIAVSQADVAVVTNVISDHFGEYGIDDLEGLAQAKLTVASALSPDGLLVLNAEDRQLRAQAESLTSRFGHSPRLGWFAATPNQPALQPYRSRGDSTCEVRDGHLILNLGHAGNPAITGNAGSAGAIQYDLGPVAAMPLSMGGIAAYNIANMAGAALAATALGITAVAIAKVLAKFGADLKDNPGRMMRFEARGIKILIDYAHNPDGLRGFLEVASHLRTGTSRLGLLLGQAGNRNDADIEQLAQVTAEFRPDLVVVKENEAQLRGRAPGEMPGIIRAKLQRLGFADAELPIETSEVAAARYALQWARPGDVLALPLHSSSARAAVIAMLNKP